MAAADESSKSQGGGADQSHQREAQPADADEVAENRDNVDRQQGQSRPADDGTGINPRVNRRPRLDRSMIDRGTVVDRAGHHDESRVGDQRTAGRRVRHIADPSTYPDWLVGAQTIRSVDDAWPDEGSAFRHVIGVPPLVVRGSTTSTCVEPGRRLDLACGNGVPRRRPGVVPPVRLRVGRHPRGGGRAIRRRSGRLDVAVRPTARCGSRLGSQRGVARGPRGPCRREHDPMTLRGSTRQGLGRAG